MVVRVARLVNLVVLAAILFSGGHVVGQVESPEIAYIRTSNHQARLDYLGKAVIWQDPGRKTPEDILNGQPGRFPFDFAEATSPEGLPCEFVQPGRQLGGKTQKFICRGPNGQTARVKYYEPPHGNREIFGSVASTRLMWALGFDADAVYPVRVNCIDCPKDPWTGRGDRSSRVLTSVIEARFQGTLILSGHNSEEGWTWAQLDHAIQNLPAGEFRDRQRTHFEALTLLGVLIQHGDRKSSQQRLVCRGEINFEAGDVHPASSSDGSGWTLPALFERRGEMACKEPVVTVQDAGATFGAAGAFTDRITSKMSLKHWASKPVFRDAPDSTECVGELSISLHSGAPGEPHQLISEQGRQFLLEQLKRLDDAHLKALFTVAQVEVLGDENRYEDPDSGTVHTGVDAWVTVFKKKVN